MARQEVHPTQAGHPAPPAGDRTEPAAAAAVTTPVVACEGVPGEESHPIVFMTFGPEGEVMCPYCNRRFRLAAGAAPGH